jgi:hypothetical protein
MTFEQFFSQRQSPHTRAEKIDLLPPVALPGVVFEPMKLELTFMRMGEGEHGPSWLARMIALPDPWAPSASPTSRRSCAPPTCALPKPPPTPRNNHEPAPVSENRYYLATDRA